MPNSSKIGRFFGVELHAADELRLEAAHELDDLGEFLFGVDPDGAVVGRDVIAQDALDEIQVAMQKRGRLALFGARFDFRPRAA